MTGASGALILWQWKEEFGRAFAFPIVALFSGWILTSLDLGKRSSESWHDGSSAHSDHRLWAGYLLFVYDSCFGKE